MTASSFLRKTWIVVVCGQPCLWAQPELPGCVWTQFTHANGNLASEGCLVGGVPEGVWTNYDAKGVLQSEGERKNNKPTGVWRFFVDGVVSEEVSLEFGVKHGVQVLYDAGVLTDSVWWVNGKREGVAKSFRGDGSLNWEVPYVNDQKEGKATQRNSEGMPVAYRWHSQNRLIASEQFNRFDALDRKTGPWKVFHPSGRVVETGTYLEGMRHGVFQYFDARGNLTEVREYRFDQWIQAEESTTPVVEVQERRRENGTLEETVTLVDGVMQGVSRRYDESGEVVGGALFEQGVLVAEGITTEEGERDGPWKTFWPHGAVRSEGMYQQGLREGEWVFYRRSGEVEQRGAYQAGELHGVWTWWYEGGEVHRTESYRRGKPHGAFTENKPDGTPLVQGLYDDGLKEGLWVVEVNDHREEGVYVYGQKDGVWTHTYGSGQRQFEGAFDLGQPTGKHKTWHPNGVLEESGSYESGAKHGKWKLYSDEGLLLHEYIYRYGKLRKVDGIKVDKRRDGKLSS